MYWNDEFEIDRRVQKINIISGVLTKSTLGTLDFCVLQR